MKLDYHRQTMFLSVQLFRSLRSLQVNKELELLTHNPSIDTNADTACVDNPVGASLASSVSLT